MDFVSSMASKVSGAAKDSSGGGVKQDGNQATEQKWNEVGKEAKEAFEDYQSKSKDGKNPDYKEIGQVAQKAFTAYKADGGNDKDLAGIGKSIAGGFMGGKKEEAKKEEAQKD